MKHTIKIASALEVVSVMSVATAMAYSAATRCDSPFHKPTYLGYLDGVLKWLLSDAGTEALPARDQFGTPGTLDDAIKRAQELGTYSEALKADGSVDADVTHGLCVYVSIPDLNRWGSATGDSFAIDASGAEWIDERGLMKPGTTPPLGAAENHTVLVDGKEAVPLRLLPFASRWLSPFTIACSLAHKNDDGLTLRGFRLCDGRAIELLPREWDDLAEELFALEEKLRNEERYEGENRIRWKSESLRLLPAAAFVWRDAVAAAHGQTYQDHTAEDDNGDGPSFIEDRPGDNALRLDCFLEPENKRFVFEGFDIEAAQESVQPVGDKPEQEQRHDEAGLTDCTAGDDADLARLFDPVSKEQLEVMFPDGKWGSHANYAPRNGLKAARVGRAKFNPFLAARWWIDTRSPAGWDWSKCVRKLANNLPPRSLDSKHLLTGDFD